MDMVCVKPIHKNINHIERNRVSYAGVYYLSKWQLDFIDLNEFACVKLFRFGDIHSTITGTGTAQLLG